MGPAPLLTVDDLRVQFPVRRRSMFGARGAPVRAVDGVSLALGRGETLGLVGESGSGKSSLGRAIVGLVAPTGGRIAFDGVDITRRGPGRDALRRRIALVFQNPFASLNPRMTVGNVLADPLEVHRIGSTAERHRRVRDVLAQVGLDPNVVNRYPHQFSGGQRQRIGIARALILDPRLLVCDEPVSALDVSVQAQILNLLRDVQRRLGLSVLLISHDLAVVRHLSDRVAVLYVGKLMEVGSRADIYGAPRHPYTRALLGAAHVPDPRIERARHAAPLIGEIPSPSQPPPGCRFQTRCPLRASLGGPALCATKEPALEQLAPAHWAACHFTDRLDAWPVPGVAVQAERIRVDG